MAAYVLLSLLLSSSVSTTSLDSETNDGVETGATPRSLSETSLELSSLFGRWLASFVAVVVLSVLSARASRRASRAPMPQAHESAARASASNSFACSVNTGVALFFATLFEHAIVQWAQGAALVPTSATPSKPGLDWLVWWLGAVGVVGAWSIPHLVAANNANNNNNGNSKKPPTYGASGDTAQHQGGRRLRQLLVWLVLFVGMRKNASSRGRESERVTLAWPSRSCQQSINGIDQHT